MNRRSFSHRSILPLVGVLVGGGAGCASTPPTQPNLDATLWVETAAEYGAAARSVYVAAAGDLPGLLADSTLSAALEQEPPFATLPPAVILDVDETVLDNSPYQARMLLTDDVYSSDTWAAWVAERRADAVPGAVDFTRAARRLGIDVFYVTNRRATEEGATRDNLLAAGFPLRDDVDDVLSLDEKPEWHDTKSSRRAYVARTHRVLMMVGDDLNDFVDVEGLSVEERDDVAKRFEGYWGERWRLVPGPTYGSWERALFDSDFSLTPSERIDRKRKHLAP